jgi:hypothetical protein
MAAVLRGVWQGLAWRRRSPPAPMPTALPQLTDYFARPREETLLARQLRGTPRFTVLLGAAATGKSALLSHVLQPWASSVAYVDLRQHCFADWHGFYLLLSHHFSSWASAASAVERVMPAEVTLPFGLGAIKTAAAAGRTPQRSIYDLSTLLSAVSDAIVQPADATDRPARRWPVLVIDDAHKLAIMAQAPTRPDDANSSGELALQTFLDWCAALSHRARVHAVMMLNALAP